MEAVEKMTPEEAAKYMGISTNILRLGLQQGKFPFGVAIQSTPSHYTYWISRKKFMSYLELEDHQKGGSNGT